MMKYSLKLSSIFLTLTLSLQGLQEPKKHYEFLNDPIDALILCHEKDIPTLDHCINGLRENVQSIRRIIVVSNRRLTNNAEWFDESNFPFTKETLALEIFNHDAARARQFVQHPKTRIGWIFKQIANLYGLLVIPDISSNVLIIDADTVFLRPVAFLDAITLGGLYNPGTEYHIPYFDHGARLISGFRKLFPHLSGISHHMLFQRSVIEDFHSTIWQLHGMEPWKAICRCLDHSQLLGSAMADYELYFNFVFARTDQVKIRNLRWANINNLNFNYYKNAGYDFVSAHTYMRPS